MKNTCNFIGNLGDAPTIREMQSGGRVASFDIAVTDKWTDKATGERRESTQWIPIVIFNENLVKVAEAYLRKGSKIAVSGAWQTRSWESDGVKKWKTECVLQRFNGELVLLDSRNEQPCIEQVGTGSATANNEYVVTNDFDDEIPF